MPVSCTVQVEPWHVAVPVSWFGPWLEQSYVQLVPDTQAAPAVGMVAGHAPPSSPASRQTVPMSCTVHVPLQVATPGVLSHPKVHFVPEASEQLSPFLGVCVGQVPDVEEDEELQPSQPIAVVDTRTPRRMLLKFMRSLYSKGPDSHHAPDATAPPASCSSSSRFRAAAGRVRLTPIIAASLAC